MVLFSCLIFPKYDYFDSFSSFKFSSVLSSSSFSSQKWQFWYLAKNSMARVFKGRIYKLLKVIGSWWKSHVLSHDLKHNCLSWPLDLFQFVYPSFESLFHAVFRTGLVFTVAITKNIARSQMAASKTSHLLSRCQVVLNKRLVRDCSFA